MNVTDHHVEEPIKRASREVSWAKGAALARCKLYEIPGPDAARTASAVRCHRDATARVTVGDQEVPICDPHQAEKWTLFLRDGWVYAVDIKADPPNKKQDKNGKSTRE